MTTRSLVLAIVGAVALAAAGYGLYRFGMTRGMTMAAPAPAISNSLAAQLKTDETGRRVLYWHDPMVPGQKFDKPGKSPFMDMQLVPVYADEAGDEGTVKISPRLQQNLGVRTAEVVLGTLTQRIEAVGSVGYNERDIAVVQARNNGFLEKLHMRAPLDAVRKHQALAEIYVPEWVAAQEEYLAAERVAGSELGERMQGLLDGARQRMRLAGMTEEQIQLVESSGTVHARLTLTAPISGVITELGAREGMTVMAGAALFRINGLSTVWINAEVPENLAAQVRPGNAVEVRTQALPGTSFKGRVSAILPEVAIATRTLKVRIEVGNPGGRLVPGMFATIDFASHASRRMLLVPTEAVIQTGERSVVMVAEGEGRFAPVDVEVGMQAGGQTEIRQGLEAGQKVVVSGQFLIDSEASLKGTTQRMDKMPAANGESAAGSTHHAQGQVESIGKNSITLSHGPVESLHWGPMTMGFALPPGGLPKNIRVGDSVTFEFREASGGMFEITRIVPASSSHPAHEGDGGMDDRKAKQK